MISCLTQEGAADRQPVGFQILALRDEEKKL